MRKASGPPARKPGKAKPKSKSTSGRSKPRKSAAKSKSAPKAAATAKPASQLNSSLEGHTRRAIDIHEGTKVDARAFKTLVKAAVAQNGATARNSRVR
jgi:hypothetical protein